MESLNLFYEEPDLDRWFPFDRYPRGLVRRVVRGRSAIGGQQRVFLNLCAGLDLLGVKYRVNDYAYARRHPGEVVCIIGKPHVLDKMAWKNPILFGAAVFSHPVDDPNLLQRLPVQRVLVPGEWYREMFQQTYGDSVISWPVGIDTNRWIPGLAKSKDIDVLVYDKVLWEREYYEPALIFEVHSHLARRRLTTVSLRYRDYREDDFFSLLRRVRSMVYLSPHEAQGIAYQQALSCGVPIIAWDPGGFWPDPSYYPHKVKFSPVTSVPYWDERCGVKFQNVDEFPDKLDEFLFGVNSGRFTPRDYILESLTLEHCATRYLQILKSICA